MVNTRSRRYDSIVNARPVRRNLIRNNRPVRRNPSVSNPIMSLGSIPLIGGNGNGHQSVLDNGLLMNLITQLTASFNSLREEVRELKSTQSASGSVSEGNGDSVRISNSVPNRLMQSKVPKHLVTLPKFDINGDINLWVERVEKCSSLLGLTDNELLDIISLQLDAKMFQWFSLQRAKSANVSWQTLKIALLRKYGAHTLTSLKEVMYNKKQGDSESVNDYLIEKLTLINRADSQMLDVDKIEIVRSGLRPDVLKLVAHTEFSDFDNFLVALERLDKAYEAASVKREEKLKAFECKRERLEEQEKKVIFSQPKPFGFKRRFPLKSGRDEKNQFRVPNSNNNNKGNQGKNFYCHNCFQTGHKSFQCTKPKHGIPMNLISSILLNYKEANGKKPNHNSDNCVPEN